MAPKKKISDRELVEKMKAGSLAAFEEIIARHEAKIFNIAMRYMRNQEDAEEVLQDVFTTLFRKVHLFQGKSAFSSWLYRIVVNAAFMKLRKRKQGQAISLEDLSPITHQKYVDLDEVQGRRIEPIGCERELQEKLEAAITKLPDEYRAVFLLRDVDGLSNEEVGQVLQISLAAVKSRLHRSRLMLRKRLQKYYDEFSTPAASSRSGSGSNRIASRPAT